MCLVLAHRDPTNPIPNDPSSNQPTNSIQSDQLPLQILVQPIQQDVSLQQTIPVQTQPQLLVQPLMSSSPPTGHSIILNSLEDTLKQNIAPILISPAPISLTDDNLTIDASQTTSSSMTPTTKLQTMANYVQSGPHINPNFSKVIDLPVTPSPPPLLEDDENVENSNQASPLNQPNVESAEYQQLQQPSLGIDEPKVPQSHLNTVNQYPSLNKIPPTNIVHSFSPVYSHQHLRQNNPVEGDLYSDYANNPYNLTLQVESNYNSVEQINDNFVTNQTQMDQSTTATPTQISMAAPTSTGLSVFQSVNYFGSSSDSQIPPGSEMLFSGP